MLRHAIALIVALMVLSVFEDQRGTQVHVVTGTIVAWHDAELAVANEHTDPRGLRFVLRDTAYDGDPRTISLGDRVTVWYKDLGEGRAVAVTVRVLATGTSDGR